MDYKNNPLVQITIGKGDNKWLKIFNLKKIFWSEPGHRAHATPGMRLHGLYCQIWSEPAQNPHVNP